MEEEKTKDTGGFKAIEKIKIVPSVVPVQTTEDKGTENAVCVVAVSSIGEVGLITIINIFKAVDYYVDEADDYIESDFSEGPGVYLVEFSIDGCGPDYNNEYDSWAVFHTIIKYKISIEDKRKHQFKKDSWSRNFGTKTYNDDPGSEYPRCLFIIDDNGAGFILDILNEDKAYKSVIEEAIPYMDESLCETDHKIKPRVLYEADLSIVGDMENLLDRDLNEDIKFSNIKQIKLILEDEPLERESREEKQKAEWKIWGEYVDELRMKDEHIK